MTKSTDDQIITFETYYDPMLAHIVRTKLESEGVACFIADENAILANPLFNQALNGIKIKIFAADLEKCKAILAANNELQINEQTETDPETNNIIVCPYCSSPNVRYETGDEKNEGILDSISNFISNLSPFSSSKQWHCLNCKRNFE